MASDPFYVPVSAHSQLKLHSIVPMTPPSRLARTRLPSSKHETSSGASASSSTDTSSQGQRRHRSDTFVAHNVSIFSAPANHAAHAGSIPVHRPSKKVSDTRHHETRRHGRADPIAFDPFSDSPYYAWLTQDPASSAASQHFRRDGANLRGFREWMTSQFPKTVKTFKSLEMLHDRPPPAPVPSMAGHEEERRTSDSDSTEDDADLSPPETTTPNDPHLSPHQRLLLQQREAQQQAWSILLESAKLLCIPPGDVFVTQDVTPVRDVFFVLSGQCQILFQPKFLDAVVQVHHALKPTPTSRQDASPPKHGAPDPLDLTDLEAHAEALVRLRRLSLSTLTAADATEAMANTVYPLRVLASGDCFGLEACVFRFPHHSVSAVSHGALQRNAIGVATDACLHVLVLPFHAIERIRTAIATTRDLSTARPARGDVSKGLQEESLLAPRRRTKRSVQHGKAAATDASVPLNIPDPLPGCAFHDDDVEFLRHTFLLQSIHIKRLQFLATQVRRIHVPQHEYLFTTGQEVLVYLVRSGQLRVFSPEQVRMLADDDECAMRTSGDASRVPLTTVETRHVELEILQTHDMIGLMEASVLQPTFRTYCLAMSHDVWVYAIPPVALFTVLAHEPTASQHAVENLQHHHAWYKARKFTALNHHNKQTAFRLPLSAQRKSPIPCSRCGWSGHTSTSSLCVRAVSVKSAFIEHLMGKEESKPEAPRPAAPSFRSRMDRVSQLRLAQANRTGSMAAAPTAEGESPSSGPRTASMVVGRGGGISGSLLPGLADLAMLLRTSKCKDEDPTVVITTKSDVEKALDRLDAALDADEIHMPAITSPRPQTEQTPRHRPAERSDMLRGSVFNLREEAVKAVARIGTATTTTPSPRVAIRRKATTSVD